MILDQSLKDQDLISDLCEDQDHLKRSPSWQKCKKNWKWLKWWFKNQSCYKKLNLIGLMSSIKEYHYAYLWWKKVPKIWNSLLKRSFQVILWSPMKSEINWQDQIKWSYHSQVDMLSVFWEMITDPPMLCWSALYVETPWQSSYFAVSIVYEMLKRPSAPRRSLVT